MATFEESLPQTATEVVQRSKTDVQRELDKVDNPNRANVFLEASYLGAIPTAAANRIFDYYLQLVEAKRLNFPDTTEGEGADQWGSIYVGTRNAAEGSTGNVVATGTIGITVGLTDSYQSSDGITYNVTSAAIIAAEIESVDTLTRIGTLATCTTDDPHNLASNVPVTIAGANEALYNGTQEIIVTGLNTFTYILDSDPGSDATGTITAAFSIASVPVEAEVPADPDAPFGAATNQTLDTPLTLTTPIIGIDDIANVDFNELAGGADIEEDDPYKGRYLDKIRNPVGHFSDNDIDQKIRDDVAGVTRTFIQKSGTAIGTISVSSITRDGIYATVTTAAPHGMFTGAKVSITGAVEVDYNVTDVDVLLIDATTFAYLVAGSPTTPATGVILSSGIISLGRVQIYFVRDFDDDIIPTAPEIAEVLAAVLEITPANTPDSFVIVLAPTPLDVDFTFTELTPDLPTLRDAVEANLLQFFEEQVDVGVDVDEDAYRSAIFNTVDTASGLSVTSFDLATPSGDILVDVGELPVLSTVTFP